MYTFTKSENNSNVFITDNNGNNFILPGNTQVKNNGDNIVFWINGSVGIQSISLNYLTEIDWAACSPAQTTPGSITNAMSTLYSDFFFNVNGGGGGANFWEENEGSTSIVNKPAYDGGYFRRVEDNTGNTRVHLVGSSPNIDENSSGITITNDSGDLLASSYVSNEQAVGGIVNDPNTLQALGYHGTFYDAGSGKISSGHTALDTQNGEVKNVVDSGGISQMYQSDVQGTEKENWIRLAQNGDIEISRKSGDQTITLYDDGFRTEVFFDDGSLLRFDISVDQIVSLSASYANGNSSSISIDGSGDNPRMNFQITTDQTPNFNFNPIPSYANHAAADADTTLLVNSLYLLNSQQEICIKK